VILAWRKCIWRCRESACKVRTWTERVAAVGPRAVLTEPAGVEAVRRVDTDAHAVAAVARDLSVSGATIMRAVDDHGFRWWRTCTPARVTGLGLDETSYLKVTRLAPTRWVTAWPPRSPAAASLRGGMANAPDHETAKTLTALGGVEPDRVSCYGVESNPGFPPCEICAGHSCKELRGVEERGGRVRNAKSVAVDGRIRAHDPPLFAGWLPGRYGHRLLPVCCPMQPGHNLNHLPASSCLIPAA
jgi:hypothetical protein